MKGIYSKIKAFFFRDLFNHASYKLHFLFTLISPYIVALFLFYMSKSLTDLVDSREDGDYFFYVIVGIALAEIAIRITNVLNSEIRNYQLTGIFEEIVNLKQPIISIFSYSFIYPITLSLYRSFTLLFVAYFFFDLNISFTNIGLVLFALAVVALSSIGIGFIAGAYCIFFKKGNPISTLNSYGTLILGGVFFPSNIFPEYISNISNILPIYHAAEIIRFLFQEQLTSEFELINHYIALSLLSLLYLVLGIMLCNYALKLAKKDGTLIFY